jgi:hypothetical protein
MALVWICRLKLWKLLVFLCCYAYGNEPGVFRSADVSYLLYQSNHNRLALRYSRKVAKTIISFFTSVCLSFCPSIHIVQRGSRWKGFSWNFTLSGFTTICGEKSFLVTIGYFACRPPFIYGNLVTNVIAAFVTKLVQAYMIALVALLPWLLK